MFNFSKEIKSPENIYITGDLNCQSYRLMIKINMRKIKNSHIIVLGNFGIGTINEKIENKNLIELNEQLNKNNNKLYLLRGNLDNKIKFEKYINNFNNIIFTKDYDIIKIENLYFLFVGGSMTYDRSVYFDHIRHKPEFFFPINIPYNKKINVVLSHENVDFIYPYNLNHIKIHSQYDKWISTDVKKDRNRLNDIYKSLKDRKLNIKSWYSSKHNNDIIEKKDNVNFIQIKKLDIQKIIF